ncbi:MAG TPA: glycosyltransferase family A protein [Coxiellaceae bacterium]|nr:glycosyltransferase family A protein [Coxiellaceae bacterium]
MSGISVVICTYNRLNLLQKCLDSLLKQNLEKFEVICVNDKSEDGTKEYLDSLNDPRIKIVHHQQNMGLSPSRNDGWKLAQYDIVAFTDDDCIARPDWLVKIEQAFTDPAVHFGSGQTFYVSETYRGYFPERVVTNLGARWPKGNNLIFRKPVLEQIGGFNPEFDYFSNDDSEIAIRAVSFGFKFKSMPEAVMYHQKTVWSIKSLLNSARNPSVWVMLKKLYPNHYQHFNPPVKSVFIHGEDYLQIMLMPIFLPILFIRFVSLGRREYKLFFTKWPRYPFLRRYHIYKQAWKQKTLML